MNYIGVFFKWVLIILFFPLSFLFLAYFRQREAKKAYRDSEEEEDLGGWEE